MIFSSLLVISQTPDSVRFAKNCLQSGNRCGKVYFPILFVLKGYNATLFLQPIAMHARLSCYVCSRVV